MDFAVEEDRGLVEADVERKASGDLTDPCIPEYRILRPDGGVRWISARIFPICDEQGEVCRIAGICEDITDRKQAEQLARQHEAELAHAWRISTMGEMASGIAHELNQPLFSIMVYIETCRIRIHSGQMKPDEMFRDLDRVMAAAESAGDIIQRLRNFIREREPQRSTIDVNEMIGEVLHIVEILANEKKVQVRLQTDTGLPTALGDLVLVQQMVLNLVRNAIEEMEEVKERKRRLTIQTRRAGPEAVEVLVGDTGGQPQGGPAGHRDRGRDGSAVCTRVCTNSAQAGANGDNC